MKLGLNGINVGLVEERGEISGLYKGIPQNSVGLRTDILENTPKPTGIKMLIRSMAPQVVVADEIGTYEDIKAINEQYIFPMYETFSGFYLLNVYWASGEQKAFKVYKNK